MTAKTYSDSPGKIPLILELSASNALSLAPAPFHRQVARMSVPQRMALADDMINHLDMPGMEERLQRLQELHAATRSEGEKP